MQGVPSVVVESSSSSSDVIEYACSLRRLLTICFLADPSGNGMYNLLTSLLRAASSISCGLPHQHGVSICIHWTDTIPVCCPCRNHTELRHTVVIEFRIQHLPIMRILSSALVVAPSYRQHTVSLTLKMMDASNISYTVYNM